MTRRYICSITDIQPERELLGPYDLSKINDEAYMSKIINRVNSIRCDRKARIIYEMDDYMMNRFRVLIEPKKRHNTLMRFLKLFTPFFHNDKS